MKCINKKRKNHSMYGYRRRKSNPLKVVIPVLALVLLGFIAVFVFNSKSSVYAYEKDYYNKPLYSENLKIDELCVAAQNVSCADIETDESLHAAALFDLDDARVICADKIHDRVYPASTTKILTAYLALKYGNLEDVITVSETATGVPLDSSRAGLLTGDQLTLETLLYGLMLPSGNDSAVAIAEYISGSEEEFVALMNREAKLLGATNSNFVNSHGYHNKNHYTTAYDLYLIFNECVKNETFLKIISTADYTTNITQRNGTYRTVTWRQSNQYINGTREMPSGVTVVGGKTGTTDEAGNCLIMYATANDSNPNISIVMGADDKSMLYENMNHLISKIADK